MFLLLPGNSHALAHHDSSPEHHIAVKLGSLSLDSADCYCYTCNDEVKVPELAKYLLSFNIDITQSVKTEKNLTELQIEQNVKWDFNMDNSNGEASQPLFGKGLTGFKNLGNSCYLASVLQVLFSVPEIASSFHIEEGMPVEKILNPGDPAKDLETQLFKIGDGLLSGRYSVPDETTTEEVKYQRGIKPSGFKSLVGEGHPEFCSMQQQDAFEFWMYLIDKLERQNVKGISEKTPTDVFQYVVENKLKCLSCGGVRINKEITESLCLPVNDELLSVDEEGKKHYKQVTFEQSIENWSSPDFLDLNCPKCGSEQHATKQQYITQLPKYLVISPQRIKLENWVPMKLNVPIKFKPELDLSAAVSDGKLLEGEELIEEEPETEPEYTFNSEAMSALVGMGFPEIRCKKALYATGNSDAEAAMNWLFGHMEDPDIDAPFEPVKNASQTASKKANDQDVQSLIAMGFTEKLANKALLLNGGNVEGAVDWLFSNPDDDGEIPENEDSKSETLEEKIERLKQSDSNGGSKFELKAVICHKGASIHSGHYVAFIKKQIDGVEKWVLFNDEKVALANEENISEIETSGYIYLFKRNS